MLVRCVRLGKQFLPASLNKMAKNCLSNERSGIVVDLRSDTVTKPSDAMRSSMMTAVVADDVLKEDPTVNELENKCAKLFGKESAIFVPSGSMANLISIMAHCYDRRGCEIIVGDKQHIHKYEQGGYAQIAGVSAFILPNEPDGTISMQKIESAVRDHTDFHQPKTQLICLENTHNYCGGRVLSLDYHREVYNFAQSKDIKVHIDGARLMNASVALGVEIKDIAKYADSVAMCFSKGLGAPIGSILCGSNEFIERAMRLRKLLGGGWRQAGVIAAPALIALDNGPKQISSDHENAKILAKGINDLKSSLIKVDVDLVETNIIMVQTDENLPAEKLVQLLEEKASPDDISVRCFDFNKRKVRLVTHCDISSDDIKAVIEKFKRIMSNI
jgi:threonine aldolase